MRGVLITNDYLRAEGFARLRDMFLAAAEKRGMALEAVGNSSCVTLPRADFALFYDKDIRLAARLEIAGMPVFNSARAIALCDDKTITYLELLRAGIPQPETVLCPKTYPGLGYGAAEFVERAGEALGWPLIMKEGMGSFGEQVWLCHTAGEARLRLRETADRPVLFQRFVASSAGRDRRLFVVGGRLIAAIERRAPVGDFRANIAGGGSAVAVRPTPAEEALALSACAALGLDFGGVDVLDDDGTPLVCEVNSNAHFAGLYAATGVNAAEAILDWIGGRLCGGAG